MAFDLVEGVVERRGVHQFLGGLVVDGVGAGRVDATVEPVWCSPDVVVRPESSDPVAEVGLGPVVGSAEGGVVVAGLPVGAVLVVLDGVVDVDIAADPARVWYGSARVRGSRRDRPPGGRRASEAG